MLKRGMFNRSEVREVFSPPSSMQRRIGGVRIKSRVLDIAIFVLYMPIEAKNFQGKKVVKQSWVG